MLGVGFERSGNRYQPYLAAAKRKFPNQPAAGLPVAAEPVGRAELLGPAARRHRHRRLRARRRDVRDRARDSRSARAARDARSSALVAAGWILVAAGRWNAVGIVAGIPLDAVTWLGLGLAAVAVAIGGLGSRPGEAARDAVLVTGGAGFIGSNLVRALLERGDEVRVLDNFSTGSRANLDGLDVEIVEGELRSYERVHNAVRGVEVVFHLGALGSVPRSVQDPLTSSAVNVEGTLNVLLAARDEGVRRVVFSSSTSVYGSSRELPTPEDSPPDPISPYGVAKLAAERYCIAFSRVYESFETVVLRYFNVFGPRQSPLSQYAAVVPLFITAIAAGEPVTIHGDGEQSRDFTYVDNVVDATIAAGARRRARAAASSTSRAARPASVNHVADTIGEILGRPVEKRFAPVARRATSATRGPTSTAAREVLGYEPAVSLEEGLRRTATALVSATERRERPSRSASCG